MIERFEYPTTKEALLALLSPEAVLVAGATALYKDAKLKAARYAVDITRCGLDAIKVRSDAIEIGATARLKDLTVQALGDSPEARMLADTAFSIASTQIRAAVTVGGNVVQPAPWSDLPVAFYALNAKAQVEKPGEVFELDFADLCGSDPRKLLRGGLLTKIIVPIGQGARKMRFDKFQITDTEIALANFACAWREVDGKIDQPRMIIGTVCPRPYRATQMEAALQGQAPTIENFANASKIGISEIDIMQNFRMKVETRARILPVFLRRALEATQNNVPYDRCHCSGNPNLR